MSDPALLDKILRTCDEEGSRVARNAFSGATLCFENDFEIATARLPASKTGFVTGPSNEDFKKQRETTTDQHRTSLLQLIEQAHRSGATVHADCTQLGGVFVHYHTALQHHLVTGGDSPIDSMLQICDAIRKALT